MRLAVLAQLNSALEVAKDQPLDHCARLGQELREKAVQERGLAEARHARNHQVKHPRHVQHEPLTSDLVKANRYLLRRDVMVEAAC